VIQIYTQLQQGQHWLRQYQGCQPIFACILGFTATGLIPGISAAGATPAERQYTAIADAEFLVNGPQPTPKYPLPLLEAGASPTLISRAIVEALDLPVYLLNAGLPQSPASAAIDLAGVPAHCLTSGKALPLAVVKQLFAQGLDWGEKLGAEANQGYLLISECVVGGTTTALSLLTGLGIAATNQVNSSHTHCNHTQKQEVVTLGLKRAGFLPLPETVDPLALVAAVGDPMQVVAAGMAIAASRKSGVLLAGGTQMLAVYALMQAIMHHYGVFGKPHQVVVGTTRWVAEDPTGDTVGLARNLTGVPLLATQLSLAASRYPQLRAYEQGYVKEGVGAGGCAIAAHLERGWSQPQLLETIEGLVARYSGES
jgi:uncharacterized protein (TIGR00303 family)